MSVYFSEMPYSYSYYGYKNSAQQAKYLDFLNSSTVEQLFQPKIWQNISVCAGEYIDISVYLYTAQ